MIKTRVKIIGRVQGVFYRQSTCTKARSLGLSGWVRNMPDGSVEVEIIGSPERVEELLTWCHSGPPAAKVTCVEIQSKEVLTSPLNSSLGFEIR